MKDVLPNSTKVRWVFKAGDPASYFHIVNVLCTLPLNDQAMSDESYTKFPLLLTFHTPVFKETIHQCVDKLHKTLLRWLIYSNLQRYNLSVPLQLTSRNNTLTTYKWLQLKLYIYCIRFWRKAFKWQDVCLYLLCIDINLFEILPLRCRIH